MARIPIRTFLATAKEYLADSLRSNGEKPTSFVIGNESADLDSITCALVYGYIQSSTAQARRSDRCTIPVTNIPSSELRLRPELEALLRHADLRPSDLITLDDLGKLKERPGLKNTTWTLVDHNALQGELGWLYSNAVTGVIDHHTDEGAVRSDAEPRVIEKTGSCSSHVVEYCKTTWDEVSKPESSAAASSKGEDVAAWDAQVAKLALGSILIDTVNLKAKDKVTNHDQNAIKYLESIITASKTVGPKYNRESFFNEVNDAKSNLDSLSLEDILEKDYKQWEDGGIKLGIASVVQPISYLKSKNEDLVPALLEFAKRKDVQLFAIMTAHNSSGNFERQLLLMALDDGKPTNIAEKFVEANSDELQLEDSSVSLDTSKADWLKVWEAKNLSASRKQVAPMIRESMKSSNSNL